MKFVSSISSLPISAQSAAFAPTNSADVSAIASAYQVVSATATQLYAGTAYVTSVNGAPLSASRAGNAANASLASSAYYDGTGRLISALPDSAAVSAIASAYAESAASSKQDELTFGYDDDKISAINGSALAGQGGGGGSVVSPSGTISVVDGTSIESTNSAIRVIPSTAVTGSGSTFGTTLYTGYANLIYGKLFDVYGLGLQYYSSTSDREISIDLSTVSGAITYNIHAPSGSTSAGVLFSSIIDTAYNVSATPTPETVSLSGDNPLLFLQPGSPISTVDVLAWASDIPSPVRFNVSGGYVNKINDSSISAYTAYMAYTSDNASFANLANTARYDSDGRPLSAMAMQSAVPTGIVSPNATLVCQGFSVEATNSAVVTEILPGYEPVAVYTGGESLSPYSPVVAAPPSANPKSVLSLPLYYGVESTISAVFDGQTATANVGALPETVTFAVPNATSVELYCSTYRNLSGNISASASDDPIVIGVGELAWASAIPTYSYDEENKISAINGSAIAGGGGGGVTGDYVEKSEMNVTIGSGNSAFLTSFSQGKDNTARSASFVQGYSNSAKADTFAQGRVNCGEGGSFAQGVLNTATSLSFAQGSINAAGAYSLAQGYYNRANDSAFAQGVYNTASLNSFAQGVYNSAINAAVVFGKYNLRGNGSTSSGDSAAFAIGNGIANGSRHDLMLVTKDGEITMYSSTADTVGTGIMSSIRAISAAATGGGGVDSATVSAIASGYAESAASGKMDASASSSFYSTSNPSGFLTGVDLSPYQTTAGMSAYMSTSLSSDFQQVTGMSSYALSADVSATVDLVGTQSANWGGSALQLSAGPGVKLEKSGNVLVASTDETVLWSGSGYSVGDTMQTYNLSADPSDFEEIQVYGQRPLGATDTMGAFEFRFHPAYLAANSVSKICVPLAFVAGGSVTPYIGGYSVIDINTTSWHDGFTWQYQPTTTYQGTSYIAHIHKIVGINRTAGV